MIKIAKDAIHDKLVTQCFEKDEYNSKNELISGRHFDGGFKAYQLSRPACAELCRKMLDCIGFHYDNFRTQRLCVIAMFKKELDSLLTRSMIVTHMHFFIISESKISMKANSPRITMSISVRNPKKMMKVDCNKEILTNFGQI